MAEVRKTYSTLNTCLDTYSSGLDLNHNQVLFLLKEVLNEYNESKHLLKDMETDELVIRSVNEAINQNKEELVDGNRLR